MVLPNSKSTKQPFGGNKGSAAPNPGNSSPAPMPGMSTTSTSNFFGNFFDGLDFDSVEVGEFTSLPQGWYEMYVESLDTATSQAGNPQLVFTLRAVEDEEGNEVSGRPKYWLTKTLKTVWKIKSDLQALGVPPEQMGSISNDDLLNRFVMVFMAPSNNDASRIVADRLAPSRKYYGQKFSPAQRGVPQ